MTQIPTLPDGIRTGAVVSCRFPHQEAPSHPGPSLRPCLVIRTVLDTRASTWMAAVAYGTSKTGPSNSGFEYTLDADAASAAGLHRPTRFILNRLRLLSVDETFFSLRDKVDGAIGHIPRDDIDDVSDIIARMLNVTPKLGPILSAYTPARTTDPSRIDTLMQNHARGRNPNGRKGATVRIRKTGIQKRRA